METGVDMPAIDEVKVRSLVHEAFESRSRPVLASDSRELTPDEKASVEQIFRLNWQDVTVSDWETHPDVISFLAPEAFCYYLPGLLDASVREQQPHMIAVLTVLFMLDRTPDEELWDNYFSKRWTRLTIHELTAVEAWVEWLSLIENLAVDELGLIRALVNLDLLKKKQ